MAKSSWPRLRRRGQHHLNKPFRAYSCGGCVGEWKTQTGRPRGIAHTHQLQEGRVCSAKSENFCRGCGFLLVVGNRLLLRASVRCSCCFSSVCVDPLACAGRIWTAASVTPPRLCCQARPPRPLSSSVGPAGKRAAVFVPGSCLLALTSAAASLSPTQCPLDRLPLEQLGRVRPFAASVHLAA
jgi:hypothetical protein